MSKEILIQTQKGERLVAIIEKGRMEDFHIELDRYQSLLGNIYKGKVDSIMPSINAAFVNIGQEKNGFLYLTDVVSPLVAEDISPTKRILNRILGKTQSKKTKPKKAQSQISLKEGQEIIVQVVKDPFGGKGARLTTHITLPGRFLVFMPCDDHHGISKKIESRQERQRLREVIKEFDFAQTGGFIIRTVSQKQGKRELLRDAKFLYDLWQKTYKRNEQEKAPALLYEEGELTWKIVRDYLTEKIDRLIIDNPQEYERIRKFVQTMIGKQMMNKIQLYTGKEDLFDAKNISKELKKIYDTHVYCKSGCYIVIEPTEAITVVDVNSGKFRAKASPSDAAFMVNMQVIPEIARQLRLRDVGGIIVIDFIDMTREDQRRKVVDALKKELSRDHAKTEVYRISPLGLVQMTRARTGKAVESISFGKCPFCGGRGRVRIP